LNDYRAPLRDIHFVLDTLLDSERHYAGLTGCELMEPEMLEAVIAGAAKFAEEVVSPLNAPGDAAGCRFEDGQVLTPEGYKKAFELYGQGGWQALNVPVEDGGQGLPPSLGLVVNEMIGSASWAWSMYGGLALAPVTCLLNGGSEAQKQRYLPKLLTGEWAGTMCLTEAHCGSDVGLLRTRASRNDDGSYAITGTKIFVSGGEHDLADNIVHSLLARVEGAPEGTKGVSLFLIPKFAVEEDGSLGEENAIVCSSIEKKMGLKGSATCVMNFEGARGELLGKENRGLEVMFKLMNTARLGTATQGLAMGERAFQGALAYARERLQMRSLTGAKNPDGEADPIIVHPDVRRMLLTQKALVEGNRALIYWLSQLVDHSRHGDTQQMKRAEDLLELLTPIAKAFCTESGQEVTNLGLQIFGGHGYITDNGMEQFVRDGRISTVYEGTTGIQALDLVGRKVLGTGGQLLRNVTALIREFCEEHIGNEAIVELIEPLRGANEEWESLTQTVIDRSIENLDELGAASVDYTLYSGYTVLAYLWARMALVARRELDAGSGNEAFLRAKIVTARFYFERILPRTIAHAAAARAGCETLLALEADEFSFEG
jgi:alkylation response protein AidB-like acyl-CoA dehydrogenase